MSKSILTKKEYVKKFKKQIEERFFKFSPYNQTIKGFIESQYFVYVCKEEEEEKEEEEKVAKEVTFQLIQTNSAGWMDCQKCCFLFEDGCHEPEPLNCLIFSGHKTYWRIKNDKR